MDTVNKPAHYQAKDGSDLEVIDVIEAFGLNYRLGNAIKYILRHDRKGGNIDLKKAIWYLQRELEDYDGVANLPTKMEPPSLEAGHVPCNWTQLLFKFENEI
jgi:hypothetical protein